MSKPAVYVNDFGLGVSSLILGTVALFYARPLAAMGIVLGVLGLVRVRKMSRTKAALILSIAGVLMSAVVGLVSCVTVLVYPSRKLFATKRVPFKFICAHVTDEVSWELYSGLGGLLEARAFKPKKDDYVILVLHASVRLDDVTLSKSELLQKPQFVAWPQLAQFRQTREILESRLDPNDMEELDRLFHRSGRKWRTLREAVLALTPSSTFDGSDATLDQRFTELTNDILTNISIYNQVTRGHCVAMYPSYLVIETQTGARIPCLLFPGTTRKLNEPYARLIPQAGVPPSVAAAGAVNDWYACVVHKDAVVKALEFRQRYRLELDLNVATLPHEHRENIRANPEDIRIKKQRFSYINRNREPLTE